MLEKIIFFLLAVSLFVVTFGKLIKKNDTSYINFLAIQFMGILLGFLELSFKWNLNIFFKLFLYFISIILPIVIIMLEKKDINIPEGLEILKVKLLILFNKNERAKITLLKIVNKYPKSYMAHKMLAEWYEKDNQISTAIEEYVRAVEVNLKDYNSYFKVAKLLKEIDKIEESETMLKDLLKKKPDFYEATEVLGDIYYDKEMFKEVISIYLDAQKYNPAKYEIYYNLGMAYTRLNDFQRANEYYAKAAEINSLLHNGIFNMGQIAMIMSELEDAEKYFLDSLQGEDVEAGSYFYLAQIAMIKGQKEKALNYINLAIEIDIDLYEKVKEQNLFIPILKQIKIAYNQTKKISTITRKEKATQEHLYNMYNLVGNMNNIDMKMMKNLKINQQLEKDEKIIE
ncbi:MAG TPA: tetratricopeptide repeat protein [Clostridia bacterium]|nr:tetratricopeptide repeat protein [Clostridia bacterium]